MPPGGPYTLFNMYCDRSSDGDWGEEFHQKIRAMAGRSFELGITVEDLPDENNRVELSSTLTDSDGIPAPKVSYQVSENTKKIIAFHIERAKELASVAGASDSVVIPFLEDSGWHLLGTCRMGEDPETSVVNSYGQSHDVPNLYIYDGSIFVTSSGTNPTATIAALSLRAVRHLMESAKKLEGIA